MAKDRPYKPAVITVESEAAMWNRPVVRSSPVKADMTKQEIVDFMKRTTGLSPSVLNEIIQIAPDPEPISEPVITPRTVSNLNTFKFLDLDDPTVE